MDRMDIREYPWDQVPVWMVRQPGELSLGVAELGGGLIALPVFSNETLARSWASQQAVDFKGKLQRFTFKQFAEMLLKLKNRVDVVMLEGAPYPISHSGIKLMEKNYINCFWQDYGEIRSTVRTSFVEIVTNRPEAVSRLYIRTLCHRWLREELSLYDGAECPKSA